MDKDIDELNYYRINNCRRHEAQGRHFHLEKKSHQKRCEISKKRVNTINFNLQHPIVQPPTPTMVPWLPKQLKNKFDNVRIDKYVLPKKLFSIFFYHYKTILSDCHNSDEINILLKGVIRLKFFGTHCEILFALIIASQIGFRLKNHFPLLIVKLSHRLNF